MSSSEKYNKRGFYKNEDASLIGNEIISDFDGNMMLNYKTHVDLPAYLGGDFTITYNSNVEHRMFWSGDGSSAGYMINSPEWILGYRGFAVQVLNFETNFYLGHQDPFNKTTFYSGEEAPLFIPGYHYGNSLNPVQRGNRFDVITIMRADGSKILLQNTRPSDLNVTYNPRVGLYNEMGLNTQGFAIVELYDNSAEDPLPPGAVNHYRRVWYKPGDGYTYVFDEKKTNFNYGQYPIPEACPDIPKALYLTQVYSANSLIYGNILELVYERSLANGYIYSGRKCFVGLRRTSTSLSEPVKPYDLSLGYAYDKKQLYQIIINNYTENDKLILNLSGGMDRDLNPNFNILNPDATLLNTIYDKFNSRILCVKSIQDKLDRVDKFLYYKWDNIKIQRRYSYGAEYFFDHRANLINQIDYYSGKTTKFDYFDQLYPGLDCIDPNFGFRLDLDYQNIFCNMKKSNRDCFSNFMLRKRETYNKYGKAFPLNRFETYDYFIDDPTFLVGKMRAEYTSRIDSMKTKISEYDSTSTLLRTTIKNYSYYKTEAMDLNSADRTYSLKLVSEITKEPEDTVGNFRSVEKLYKYDMGSPNSQYFYAGTFDLRAVTEINRSIPSSNYTVKTDSINNTYDIRDIVYDSTSNGKLTKKIKQSETRKDNISLVSHTGFLNIFPSGRLYNYLADWIALDNTAYLYNVGLVKEEKSYSGSTVKSSRCNEYYLSGMLAGQIKKVTNNYGTGRETYVSYTYNDTPEYDGLLSSLTNDKGAKQLFYYPKYIGGVYRDTAYGYIVQYNGSKTWSSFIHNGFQTKPFKTLTIYPNSTGTNDTLVNYSSYNSDGLLQFAVDENKLHSSYAYDKIGRLVSAALPGSYIDATTPFGIHDVIACSNNFFITAGGTAGWGFPTSIDTSLIVKTNGGFVKNGTRHFGFLQKAVKPAVQPIKKATMRFQIKCTINSPTNVPKTIKIGGINSSYSEMKYYAPYSYISIQVPDNAMNNNVEMEVDIMPLLQALGSRTLYGFVFYPNKIDEAEYEQVFFIESPPVCTIIYDAPGALPGETIDKQPGVTGAVVYSYDDLNNKVEEKRRMNPDPANRVEMATTIELDGLGNTRKTYIKNDAGNQELKNQSTFNTFGLPHQITDGEGRSTTSNYDYLENLFRITNTDGTIKTIDYFRQPGTIESGTVWQTNYAFYTKSVDEKQDLNSAVYTYYDISGNKVAEKTGSNKPTVYRYDEVYRIKQVVSPAGKTKTYFYDALGNLTQKDSPADEGTVYYKYDKYNRLRFSTTSGAPANERGITFTRYDGFGRITASGTLPTTFGFASMDPDKDYSSAQNLPKFENFETDTANFVIVNMYDKYNKIGIFSQMSDPFSWSQSDANSSRNLKGKLVMTAFRDKPGQGWNYKLYLYDHLGHVSHHYVKIGSGPWKYMFREEDILGNQKRENIYRISGGSSTGEFFSWNNYDCQGRLTDVRTDPNGSYSNAKVEATYTYNKADQCSTLTYNQVTNTNKNITYSYSPTRGWLTNILNGSSNFNEGLGYEKNGNISTQSITNSVLAGGVQNLSYTYDSMNRLLTVMNGTTQVESFNYIDLDGNFSSRTYTGSNYIGYGYITGTNRLSSVYLNGAEKKYSYDNKGNVTIDESNKISNITYDHRNLPLSITSDKGTSKYRYNDHGDRIYKETTESGREYYLRDDKGREVAVYDLVSDKLRQINLFGTDQIGHIEVKWTNTWDENYEEWIETRSDRKVYYVKDHLGSIRQSIDQTGTPISANDYYAFGQIKSNYIQGTQITDKYKYTGKERDQETGLDYFGARYYDSKTGRWLSVDPLADKYPGWSPYNYCLNNPLRFIDPDGRAAGDYFNYDGSYIGTDGKQDGKVYSGKKDGNTASIKGNISEAQAKELKEKSDEINMNSQLGYMIRAVYAEMRGGDDNAKSIVAESIRNRANLPKGTFERYDGTYKGIINNAYDVAKANVTSFTDPIKSIYINNSENDAWVKSITASIKAHFNESNVGEGVIIYNSNSSTFWDKKLKKIDLDVSHRGIKGLWKKK